jgi:hypothetical protein
MRKVMCTLFVTVSLFSHPTPFAAQQSSAMLEDALFSVLFPKINQSIEKYYSGLKTYDCPKIVSMKKVYSGTYVFKATIEVTKYEEPAGGKPQPPFDRVIINFSNEEGEWDVQSIKVQRLPDNTKINCRKPV